MQRNTKIITLMAALTAGLASAAAPTANPSGYTTSGTTITNTADFSFSDPSDTAKTVTGNSNTVTTTVLPLPSFDIVYDSSNPDGGGTASNAANGINTAIPTPDYKINVKPGDVVSNTYYIVNNGNTPLNVKVDANTTGNSAANSTTSTIGTLAAGAVTYTYANGATAVTPNSDGTVTLPANGVITVVQSFKVPTNAAPGVLYGASPTGTVAGTGTAGNGISSGSTLNEGQTVSAGAPSTAPAATTDMQFTVANVYSPLITNDPTPPGNTTVTPPGGTATSGYTASTPPTTGNGAPPSSGTTPGTTLVTVAGDQQIAYPPADGEAANPDVVRFNNTVKNGGALSDILTLAPVNGTGANRVDSFTRTSVGTYTGKDAEGRTVVVQFLDGNNNPIDTITVAATSSANYVTQVTYPDSNSLANQHPLDLTIRATSGNNPNISDDTFDTIRPTQAQFGDASSLTSNPLAVNPTTAQSQTGTPGATVNYAMDVANTGTYTDSYALSGYVNLVLKDGTTQTVPVVYKDNNGATLPTNSTVTVNGVSVPVYTVSNVAANTAVPVTASVTVPANAASTGATPPTLQQTASSVYSAQQGGSLVLTDLNNPLVIRVVGDIVTGKFTNTNGTGTATTPAVNTQKVANDPAKATATPPRFVGVASTGTPSATEIGNPVGYDAVNTQSYLPRVNYNYRIIAKNNYNTSVTNFALSDTLNANLQFQSATCTIYKTDGTASSTPAVTAPAVGSSGAVSCAASTLLPGQTEVLDITVRTK